ncbi:MAG: hypothetical protein FVQ83_09545 [Chloroflexi bacterium]|nr:hypothetical protein [Chloroflexota bacterium]
MKQREAVIQVMEENGGYATLGYLYEHTLKVENVIWRTKTPFASIRRIVQNNKYFFKIRPGLWALHTHKNKIPFADQADEKIPESKKHEFNHSYFQGLLVEIGNLKNLATFVPNQDKNKTFLDKTLGEITTLSRIYHFGYDNILNAAKTVDVSWFNEREMPNTFIEVEHSTNMYNSLIKFVELLDFNADFWIAAPPQRKKEFESKSNRIAFTRFNNRVKFVSYENVSKLHSTLSEKAVIEKSMFSG